MATQYLPSLAPPAAVWVFGVAAALLFGCSRFVIWVWPHGRNLKISFTLQIFAGLCLALFLLGLTFSSFETFAIYYLPVIFASRWAAAVVVVAGFALFWLRTKWLRIYAMVEIGAAIATAIICAGTSYVTPLARGAALLTATYFLIRGLDNASKAGLIESTGKYIRKYGPKYWPFAILWVSAIVLQFSKRPSEILPPYMVNVDGRRSPVSAVRCGRPFIVCDEPAWRERERLLRGHPADRARAEAEAERRFDEEEERRYRDGE